MLRKNEIVEEIINILSQESAQFKLQWYYYLENNFGTLFDIGETEGESAKFEFRKKSLRKNYKEFIIDSIKKDKSIFTKITIDNNDEIRISIIKCKLEINDDLNVGGKNKKQCIYLLICDFEESNNFEIIAESESYPEIAELYDLATFIESKEIKSVINYFSKQVGLNLFNRNRRR